MLKKTVVPSLAISVIIFVGFAMLLGQYGSHTIEIQIDNQSWIYGQVRDFINPGIGGVLGLILGTLSIAVIGYGKSLRRKNRLEKQLVSLRKAISYKDIQIQQLKKLANETF